MVSVSCAIQLFIYIHIKEWNLMWEREGRREIRWFKKGNLESWERVRYGLHFTHHSYTVWLILV